MIFSEPRGGSTWLLELLSNIPNSIVNWEPLHAKNGVVPNGLFLGNRGFIEKFRSKEYKPFFKKLLELKIHTNWTMSFNSVLTVFNGKVVITKFIQGNQLLPWVVQNFSFKHKPIHLVRHPISTCISQMKMWDAKDDILELPKSIKNPTFKRHSNYLKQLNTKLELNIAIWCISNKYALEHESINDKWMTIYYEDLLMNPIIQLDVIFKEFGHEYLMNDFDKEKIKKPSNTTLEQNLRKNSKDQIEKYLKILNKNELLEIQKILDYFDVKVYKADNPFPIKDNN